jgi:hypothetical protein
MPLPPDQLSALLRFPIHHPGPQPDPASLLQFVVELEQPAAAHAAFSAYLQYSAAVLQSQLAFVKALQQSTGGGGGV